MSYNKNIKEQVGARTGGCCDNVAIWINYRQISHKWSISAGEIYLVVRVPVIILIVV